MDIHAVVIAMIEQVAAEQSRPLKGLNNSLLLIDSGLNSLCLAVIVAKLEDELGVDPFSADPMMPFPKTIGDLITCYEHALI
jgi:acyl carrier protein